MWYNLLKNPDKFHKAQKEVDEVVGDSVITLDMLPKLHYIDACIKETLRLDSPIALFSVIPKEDTFLAGGRYRIRKGDEFLVSLKGAYLKGISLLHVSNESAATASSLLCLTCVSDPRTLLTPLPL